MKVSLSKRARRDLSRLDRGDRERVAAGLDALGRNDSNVDVKMLKGREPWRRQRIGEFRVLFVPLRDRDVLFVERIVSRQALEGSVGRLPKV
ncbi:MAG: hypothetical protein WAM30_03540 [Candidatus Dormiibacterota bacterium]